jgi:sugar lactone lactonase YvrE
MAGVGKRPQIERVSPAAAIPGGEVVIHGRGFAPNHHRPQVSFGESPGGVLVASDDFLVATVPMEAAGKSVSVRTAGGESDPAAVELAVPIADNLHPVASPAVDADGNIYATFSGRRGEKVPISLYRINRQFEVKPLVSELMNATGLALDSNHRLYVSSRYEGVVYQVENTTKKIYAEGMGVATGLAFDADDNLYVGDRSGTIFKIGRDRQIFVFATLEPSVSAYQSLPPSSPASPPIIWPLGPTAIST